MCKSTAKPLRKRAPKRVLALPDLEQSKAAVLNHSTARSYSGIGSTSNSALCAGDD